MDEPKDENNWEPLKKLITVKTSFNCYNYTDKFLRRRVWTRMYSLNLEKYVEYHKILEFQSGEKDMLLKELTIHVTNFFRNKEAFDAFVAETVMEVMNRKSQTKNHSLKIWSAGCSTGEEPFTIAMILLEILQMRIKDFNISILGTDYSPETIEKAKIGIYEEPQLKEAPPEYIGKYFEKIEDKYAIKPEVKNLVKFEVGDILSDNKPTNMDIIFCRNTVIYFTIEQKDKLYQDFYNNLNPSGFLVLGMTESLTGPAKEKFKVFNNSYRIYQK